MAGFIKRWDKNSICWDLSRMISEISSPYNDGYTASIIKKELYEIKCLIEDHYQDLPTFVDEDQWEKERLVQKLKQK